jgi:undecaprenyl phosphate N,N'-diacetylbacillosamine 1-phosphate transferase
MIDMVASILGLIVIIPLFIIIIPVVSVSNGGPVFFVQTRPGLNSNYFKLIKFRTMNGKRDSSGKLLPDAKRLTNIGRFLRSLSIDELPQLINILKGDMSFVGPRPLLTDYLPLYNARQVRRHEVRPGMTGYAQINGRNRVTWAEKFELDVWYVDNLSFMLDAKILFVTVLKVFKREGINSFNSVTMQRFIGS